MTCFKELKRFWKWSGSISEVPLSPPSSALRAPSPLREKVFFAFLEQWILQLRVNPSCRMTWGWGESGRRNQFIKICHYKRYDKNRYCSILNMNQSKINAGGINQQPMHAVSATIANSININLQSIFKQYTKRQQPMNATSMLRVSTASVQNINNQCA